MTEQPSEIDQLISSFYRCRRDDAFLDTFYDRFLSKSPLIAEMFTQTDFRLQKLMLRQSLLEMLCFHRGIEGVGNEIKRLGKRHRAMGITAEMYGWWLDALCEAIEIHDPKYTEELARHWRTAMLTSINEMQAAGDLDSPRAD